MQRELSLAETFLMEVVCVDRMTLYHSVFQLLHDLGRATIIDAINTNIFNASDLSPSQIEAVMHNSMIDHLMDVCSEFGVEFRERPSLPFLVKLLETLNLLDAWDEYEYIINVASTTPGEPKHKLYAVLNIVQDFDEVEYHSYVGMVAMGLIDTLIEIHNVKLDEFDAAEITADLSEVKQYDLTVLRNVVRKNRNLVVSRLFDTGEFSGVLEPKQITSIVAKHFADLESLDAKDLAREMIGVYLVSGLTSNALFDVIKEHAPELINSDELIARMGLVLNTVYMEMSS